MQIISNNKRPTHLNIVTRLLDTADEIIFCTAFLKVSGLKPILSKLKHKTGLCTFYVGTDYYLTEPDALKELFRQGHKIFLTKKPASTFHPKAYYFRQRSKITLLTGSANITGGGLETNFELSVLIETDKGSTIDIGFKKALGAFAEHSKIISSELEIVQYEKEFQLYRKKQKKAEKEFKEEIKRNHTIDLSQLDRYIREYEEDGGFERFADRAAFYKDARRYLNEITRKRITTGNDFLYYYEDIAKSFHSSGLLRGKTTFAKKFKTILSIVKIVQQNKSAEPDYVFSKAIPLVHSVKRFGVNALTEIMNTYNANKFSIANGRTLKSLSDLGFAEFPDANYFDVNTYKKYNELITEIALACKFKDLGQVDHFLSWYYENYVKE